MKRCDWCVGDELYEKYHDEEWGKVVYDDKILFEFLVLESAQAGLNWLTILKKRENYRKAYDDFDYNIVAEYGEGKFEELMGNKGIVRNKLKIRASINNAIKFMEIQGEWGSFYDYLWSFTDGNQIVNRVKNIKEVPAKTDLSDIISKDMKKRGFKFIGTTIIYAYLQAVGVVDDHVDGCFSKKS
ncbi:DNA-3-methyladenine glycosylase I [Psychrilyobacter atlanticus]|uniref:DNA-3-methyladenine glycosylase I n=1 Tax=Psychrilyobacter atlanticus TaxID=271091 RepID=UPI0004281114|nr:DNA-3-methyladenine glycosylase I [Psychrilyobacter atlanticus]